MCKFRFKKKGLYFSIVALLIVMFGCDFLGMCEDKEILRNSSQDNLVDYVVVEGGCGATTAFITSIFIVPIGQSVDKYDPVFLADNVEGLEITWVEPKKLVIAYSEARIFKYRNFWQSRDIENWKYIVSIKEYQQ